MTARKQNLLEAFKASAPEGRAGIKRGSEPEAPAGGPFAPAVDSDARAARSLPAVHARRGSTWSRALSDRTIQVALVLCILAVGIAAYWAGRRSANPVEAALGAPANGALLSSGANRSAASSQAGIAVQNQQAAQTGSEHDRAFMDRRNKYTVRLIQYRNDEPGRTTAFATTEWLRKEGVPAVGPIGLGKVLIVCAGHAPRQEDLCTLLTYVQGMRGPPPKASHQPFESAYLVDIDDVVQR